MSKTLLLKFLVSLKLVLLTALLPAPAARATTCGTLVYSGQVISKMYEESKTVGIFEVMDFEVDEDSDYYQRKLSKGSFRPINLFKGRAPRRLSAKFIGNLRLKEGKRYFAFFESGERTSLKLTDNGLCSNGLIFPEEEIDMYVNLVRRIKWCPIAGFLLGSWCDDTFERFNRRRFLYFGEKYEGPF